MVTVSRNDITGDAIQTGTSSDAYRNGWDRIFGKKPNAETLAAMEEAKVLAEKFEKQDEAEVYHLRSYGDVSKEDLDAYVKKVKFGGTD